MHQLAKKDNYTNKLITKKLTFSIDSRIPVTTWRLGLLLIIDIRIAEVSNRGFFDGLGSSETGCSDDGIRETISEIS